MHSARALADNTRQFAQLRPRDFGDEHTRAKRPETSGGAAVRCANENKLNKIMGTINGEPAPERSERSEGNCTKWPLAAGFFEIIFINGT